MPNVKLSLAVLALALLPLTSNAHSMTPDEYLIQGVGPGKTMGDALKVFGEPAEKYDDRGGFMRIVTYTYANGLEITGRAPGKDKTAVSKVKIAGYSVTGKGLCTTSGICVGTAISEVEQKFGTGEPYTEDDGRKGVIYSFNEGMLTLTFYLDDQGLITEIYTGSGF